MGTYGIFGKGTPRFRHNYQTTRARRRSRHINAQMRYFGSDKWKWDYAKNKARDTSLW